MGKMKVTRKVLPGKHGAVKESKIYGDKLMAVRYHRDGAGNFYKTAEVIIYERQEGLPAKYMHLSDM